jgi:restriction system protein
MSRRHGFLYTALKVSQAAARQHAAAERRRAVAAARAEREHTRAVKQANAFARVTHFQGQAQETESLNADLQQQLEDLTALLTIALAAAGPFDFGSLRRQPEAKPFDPGKLGTKEPAPTLDQYVPSPLTGVHKFLPSSRRMHTEASELAVKRYEADLRGYAAREAAREKILAEGRAAHQQECEKAAREVADWNEQVDRFAADYAEGKPSAVNDLCRLVLDNSDYPDGFPKEVKTAYLPDSKQLVVEYDCPTMDVIPEISAYKYVKSKDEITTTTRPASQRRSLYASVVAQVTLRTLHELFTTDIHKHLESIVFNGRVNAIDKGTGQQVHPCIVTVRTTRDTFAALNLANVDPQACLKTLSASVSPSPSELVPVRRVLEFNMVDPRFVQEMDVLSTLDQRPNLMELSPTQFESLITNLFEKMGLETRQTQASRDGGVDCVAYDPRPIFGGKVIIQAKRYKNTVGVGAVRDLFGTLQNEGASKGILVTTSGYGKAAFEFANGKPLELLEGSHLLYLLEQHAGVKARIEVPDAWKDPIADVAEMI